MTRELPKVPQTDPLTAGERSFLATHDKGEFSYRAVDRTMLDACCHRGLLELADGEFLMETLDGVKGRVRLKPIYRLTKRATEWMAWVAPPAEEASK